MKTIHLISALGLLLITATGCTVSTTPEAPVTSAQAFWDGHAVSFQMTETHGFIGHTPAGSACAGDAFAYDVAAKKLHAEVCASQGTKLPAIDRVLDAGEVSALDAVLGGLKLATSAACVADADAVSLSVTDDSARSTVYSNRGEACGGTKNALDFESVQALYDELVKLASPAPRALVWNAKSRSVVLPSIDRILTPDAVTALRTALTSLERTTTSETCRTSEASA